MKYIALLRGINVGGNNKVSMAELRECFEAASFTNVSTYINSGNVFFESSERVMQSLLRPVKRPLKHALGFV